MAKAQKGVEVKEGVGVGVGGVGVGVGGVGWSRVMEEGGGGGVLAVPESGNQHERTRNEGNQILNIAVEPVAFFQSKFRERKYAAEGNARLCEMWGGGGRREGGGG